tara:strand:- start:889 stop:1569 length:681 start_codon:yes stop_codon:yes gene_type:complete
MIKCDYWFPRGIWHKENCGLDTDHFNEFATVHRGAMSGRKASNEGGFQSFDWGSERMHTLTPLKHLSEQIYDVVDVACQDLGFRDYAMLITNGWVNINGPGDLNHVHSHPGAIFGGVYYSKVPEKSGDITFMRPFDELHKFKSWGVGHNYQHGLNPLNYEIASYKPEVDKIIIFPADMLHQVAANQSSEERISYSFNVTLYSKHINYGSIQKSIESINDNVSESSD